VSLGRRRSAYLLRRSRLAVFTAPRSSDLRRASRAPCGRPRLAPQAGPSPARRTAPHLASRAPPGRATRTRPSTGAFRGPPHPVASDGVQRAAPDSSSRSRVVTCLAIARRRAAGADDLPGLPVPTALPDPGVRFTRATARPPRSDRSVSHALAGLLLPRPVRAYFIPVTLLGFCLQGFPLPQGRAPLEAPSSPAVARLARAPGVGVSPATVNVREPARLQRFTPSGSPFRRAAVRRARRPIPSWPSALWGPPSSCRRPGFPGLPLVRFPTRSHEGNGQRALQSLRLQEARRFPCGCRPLWALPPRRADDLAAFRAFR